MKNPLAWRICFEKLLLPLLDCVAHLPPSAVYTSPSSAHNGDRSHHSSQSGPAYDIGVKAASLLFQVFLHHLDTLLLSPDFTLFWLRLLGSIHQHTHNAASGSGESRTSVHFIESLKNVLLVMQASGVWDAVQQRSGQDVWTLTQQSIEHYKPEWRQELKDCLGARDASRESLSTPQMTATVSIDSRSASAAFDELNGEVSVAAFLRQQPAAAPALEAAPMPPLTNAALTAASIGNASSHNGAAHPSQPYVPPPSKALTTTSPVRLPPSVSASAATIHPIAPSSQLSAFPSSTHSYPLPQRLTAAWTASSAFPPALAAPSLIKPSFSVPPAVPTVGNSAPAPYQSMPPLVGVVPLRSAAPPSALSSFRPVPPLVGASLQPSGLPPPSAGSVPILQSAPLPAHNSLPRVSASATSSSGTAHPSAAVVIRFPLRSPLSPNSAATQSHHPPSAAPPGPASSSAVPRMYVPTAAAASERHANGVPNPAMPRVPAVLSSNGLKGMPARPVGLRPPPSAAGNV